MKVYQWIYTCSNWNITGHSGFSVFSYSNGLSDDELDEVQSRLVNYPYPVDSSKSIAELPVLFYTLKLRSGKNAMFQCCYTGKCFDGRNGNFLVHGLIADGSWPLPSACYIGSPTFWRDLPQDIKKHSMTLTQENNDFVTTPPLLPTLSENDLRGNEAFSYGALSTFLQDDNNLRCLHSLFNCVLNLNRISIKTDANDFPFFVANIQRLMSSELASSLSYISYAETPIDYGEYTIVGTDNDDNTLTALEKTSPKYTISTEYLIRHCQEFQDFLAHFSISSLKKVKAVALCFLAMKSQYEMSLEQSVDAFDFCMENSDGTCLKPFLQMMIQGILLENDLDAIEQIYDILLDTKSPLLDFFNDSMISKVTLVLKKQKGLFAQLSTMSEKSIDTRLDNLLMSKETWESNDLTLYLLLEKDFWDLNRIAPKLSNNIPWRDMLIWTWENHPHQLQYVFQLCHDDTILSDNLWLQTLPENAHNVMLQVLFNTQKYFQALTLAQTLIMTSQDKQGILLVLISAFNTPELKLKHFIYPLIASISFDTTPELLKTFQNILLDHKDDESLPLLLNLIYERLHTLHSEEGGIKMLTSFVNEIHEAFPLYHNPKQLLLLYLFHNAEEAAINFTEVLSITPQIAQRDNIFALHVYRFLIQEAHTKTPNRDTLLLLDKLQPQLDTPKLYVSLVWKLCHQQRTFLDCALELTCFLLNNSPIDQSIQYDHWLDCLAEILFDDFREDDFKKLLNDKKELELLCKNTGPGKKLYDKVAERPQRSLKERFLHHDKTFFTQAHIELDDCNILNQGE